MIAGIGIDIVEIARLKAAIEKFGSHFIARMCTEREQAGHSRLSEGDIIYYAGRWAAKEAVAKALGCGIGEHCALTDLEILDDPQGKPEVKLSGAAKATADRLKVSKVHLSISHEKHYAIATALLESL